MAGRIHIVGAGLVSPAGTGRQAGFDGLLRGGTAIRALDRFDPSLFKSRVAAQVPDQPRYNQVSDRHTGFALCAAQEALAEGGVREGSQEAGLTAMVFATAIGATERLEAIYRAGGTPDAAALRFYTGCREVADSIGLSPIRLTCTTGCTASLDALGLGRDLLTCGLAARVLVVTGEAPIVPISLAAFDRIGAVSRCPDPKLASRPFAADRDGFVLGEGGAAVLLETEESANARGAPSLAELLGWASVSSAFHMTAIKTSGEDIERVMRQALDSAGLRPSDIDVVDLHATSTKMNDLAEATAMAAVFGDVRPMVTAQKAINGHALGASNLMELVNDVTALLRGVLPPCPEASEQDPACAITVIRNPSEGTWKTLLKISSGFSGIHTAAIIGAPV